MDPQNSYKKTYKMRALGDNGLNTVVSIPAPVLQREAEKHHMTIKQFIHSFRAVAHYGSFPGVVYTFEPIEEKQPV